MYDWQGRLQRQTRSHTWLFYLVHQPTCHSDGSSPPGTSLWWIRSKHKTCAAAAGAETRTRWQRKTKLSACMQKFNKGFVVWLCLRPIVLHHIQPYRISSSNRTKVICSISTLNGMGQKIQSLGQDWRGTEGDIDELTEGKRVRCMLTSEERGRQTGKWKEEHERAIKSKEGGKKRKSFHSEQDALVQSEGQWF